MIKHLRIDNRLIHGQVAVVWQRLINANAIIVVNDDVAKDSIQKMALPLAARNSKVVVLSVDEAIQYARDNPSETHFMVAKFPSDALRILESGVKVGTVNVGNAAPIAGTKYIMVTKSCAATKEDAEIYYKIAELLGGKLSSRLVPNDDPLDFLSALKKAGL